MAKKYAVSPKVVKLVRKVQKHILEEPKRFDMGEWGRSVNHIWKPEPLFEGSSKEAKRIHKQDMKDYKTEVSQFPACGTTACIAGWAVILENPKKDKEGHYVIPSVDIPSRAAKLFEFGDACYAGQLFFSDSWPQPFFTQWADEDAKDNPSKKKLAKIAVARLEHYITTGQ